MMRAAASLTFLLGGALGFALGFGCAADRGGADEGAPDSRAELVGREVQELIELRGAGLGVEVHIWRVRLDEQELSDVLRGLAARSDAERFDGSSMDGWDAFEASGFAAVSLPESVLEDVVRALPPGERLSRTLVTTDAGGAIAAEGARVLEARRVVVGGGVEEIGAGRVAMAIEAERVPRALANRVIVSEMIATVSVTFGAAREARLALEEPRSLEEARGEAARTLIRARGSLEEGRLILIAGAGSGDWTALEQESTALGPLASEEIGPIAGVPTLADLLLGSDEVLLLIPRAGGRYRLLNGR